LCSVVVYDGCCTMISTHMRTVLKLASSLLKKYDGIPWYYHSITMVIVAVTPWYYHGIIR